MKIKKMPSLKDRSRYIVFKIHSRDPIEYIEMKNAVWNSILNFLGEEQAARANIRVIKNLWKKSSGTGFLRCGHVYVDKVKVALGLVHQIGDERVIIQSLNVSGTIKGAKKRL